MKNVALFGAGSGLELFWQYHLVSNQFRPTVVFDNNVGSCIKTFRGLDLVSFSKRHNYEYDSVVITSRHYVDIYRQLTLNDIPPEKIEIFNFLINM